MFSILQKPYRFAIITNCCLLAIGFLVQIVFGNIVAEGFAFPVNIIIGESFVLLLTIIYFIFHRSILLQTIGSVPFAIVTIIFLSILTILLGSIPAPPTNHISTSITAKLGLGQITSTWYFMLIFLLALINLWLAILKRLMNFNGRNFVFVLNHLGLWLVLFAGILGQGDLQRLNMTLHKNAPEWRATNAKGEIVELPLALEMKKFTMDIFPNKIYIIDSTGASLPKSKPQFISIDSTKPTQNLLDWKITIEKYLPNAIIAPNSTYESSPMNGSTTAALITVVDKKGRKYNDWLVAENYLFPAKFIILDSNHIVAMAPPEAKRFETEVLVYEKGSDKVREEKIEVNHPITVRGWKIYQVSYDEQLGRWSEISEVELVLDPWLPLVYFGIALLLCGTIGLLIINRK